VTQASGNIPIVEWSAGLKRVEGHNWMVRIFANGKFHGSAIFQDKATASALVHLLEAGNLRTAARLLSANSGQVRATCLCCDSTHHVAEIRIAKESHP